MSDEDKVVEQTPAEVVEQVEQVEQVETPAAEVDADEAAYEAEFAAQAAKADKRLADERGAATDVGEDQTEDVAQNTPAPVAADAKKTAADPAPAAATASEGKAAKTEAAPKAEPAWLLALPKDTQDAARAALKDADALRERNTKLEQDYRSVSGRVSAYQSRYEDLKKQMPAAAQTAVAAAEKVEDSAEWLAFKEQYSDVAKAIESRFPKVAGQDPTVAEIASWVNEQRAEKFLTEAYETVDAVHPGWRELGKTKEFKEWKESSSTYLKLAASDDVADAIALLDLYAALHPATQPVPVDAKAAAATTSLAARRDAQAQGARALKNERASPNQNLDMNDADQLFAFYSGKANDRIKKRNSR